MSVFELGLENVEIKRFKACQVRTIVHMIKYDSNVSKEHTQLKDSDGA